MARKADRVFVAELTLREEGVGPGGAPEGVLSVGVRGRTATSALRAVLPLARMALEGMETEGEIWDRLTVAEQALADAGFMMNSEGQWVRSGTAFPDHSLAGMEPDQPLPEKPCPMPRDEDEPWLEHKPHVWRDRQVIQGSDGGFGQAYLCKGTGPE